MCVSKQCFFKKLLVTPNLALSLVFVRSLIFQVNKIEYNVNVFIIKIIYI